MNWEKVGKFLVALIASAAGLTAVYGAFFKDEANLRAELTYDYQTYPRQFIDRMGSSSEELKYRYLYEKIEKLTEGSLNHEQINQIVDLSQKPYSDLFRPPFQSGLDKYATRLFIYLKNEGGKVAKDVYIKLPAKGIVEVRDDAKNHTLIETKTSNITIPSIVQNGDAKVWVYFDSDFDEVRYLTINIGHRDGVADIEIYESYKGLSANVAYYGKELVLALAVMATLLVGLLSIGLFHSKSESSNKSSNTDAENGADS